MNEIENDNRELNNKPTIQEVDDFARELCSQFNNHEYFKWYCSSIWKLGINRMREIQGRVKDAKNPGRLFTKYLNENLKLYRMNVRLEAELRKKLGGK